MYGTNKIIQDHPGNIASSLFCLGREYTQKRYKCHSTGALHTWHLSTTEEKISWGPPSAPYPLPSSMHSRRQWLMWPALLREDLISTMQGKGKRRIHPADWWLVGLLAGSKCQAGLLGVNLSLDRCENIDWDQGQIMKDSRNLVKTGSIWILIFSFMQCSCIHGCLLWPGGIDLSRHVRIISH